MPILDIITPKDPILRKKARRVSDFKSKKLQTMIDDMVDTLHNAMGVGLAAPQIAVSQRVIVVQLPDDEQSREEYGEDAGVLHIVINPEIIKASTEMLNGVEACLSIPGYFGAVSRHEAITVKGYDRNGKEIRIKSKDWLARVFQHEIDHLDGILFIDRASEMWKAKTPEGQTAPLEDPLEGSGIVAIEVDEDSPTEPQD